MNNSNIIAEKLDDILNYYKETYQVDESLDEIREELLRNNVEVNGDSFYCPIWNDELSAWILLAGTKDKADMWVLKKIFRLIKTGVPVYSLLNGNSDYLLPKLERYDVELISRKEEIVFISFNTKD